MRREESKVDPLFVSIAEGLIRRWDEPKEAEPAHGLFLRIAGRNGHNSARKFAEAMGVNGRFLFPGECRQVLRKVPIANRHELDEWTPRFRGNTVTIRGESFSEKHWSISTRRYCPACLVESAHHRAWWDIGFMLRCPFHGLMLTDSDSRGGTVRWVFPVIDRSMDGASLAAHAARLNPLPPTWEAYVLGRLGLAPRRTIYGFDPVCSSNDGHQRTTRSLSLDRCFRAILLLGKIGLCGWAKNAPDPDSHPREVVVDAGFRLVSEGQAAIQSLIKGLIAAAPRHAFGPRELLGWAYTTISVQERKHLKFVVAEMMRAVSLDGRFGRRVGRYLEESDELRRPTLEEASVALGKSVGQTSRLLARRGVHLGINRTVGQAPGITFDLVETLAAELKYAIPATEAAAVLGISSPGVLDLVKAGLLRSPDRFLSLDYRTSVSPVEVKVLLRSVMATAPEIVDHDPTLFPLFATAEKFGISVAETIQELQAGVIRAAGTLGGIANLSGVLARSTGFPLEHPLMRALRLPAGVDRYDIREGQITRADACNLLGVTMETVNALLKAGFIKTAEGTTEGERQPLCKKSVEQFDEHYASASTYADLLGDRPQMAPRRLAALGVRDLLGNGRGRDRYVAAMYSRAEVHRALGTKCDVEQREPFSIFWSGFGNYLRECGSTYRIQRHDGRVARLRSHCARWRIEIAFLSSDVTVTSLFNRAATARAAAALELFNHAVAEDARMCATVSEKGIALGFGAIEPRLRASEDESDWRLSVDRISLSGQPEVLLSAFKGYLFRALLIAVERQRAYFGAANERGPGRLDCISF